MRQNFGHLHILFLTSVDGLSGKECPGGGGRGGRGQGDQAAHDGHQQQHHRGAHHQGVDYILLRYNKFIFPVHRSIWAVN